MTAVVSILSNLFRAVEPTAAGVAKAVSVFQRTIRASVDALCRDEAGQISRDPRTKRLITRRESLAKPSKHASNSAFAHL